jgi:hypothetical protein
VTVKLPEHIFAALDRPVPYLIDIVPGETKELCLALFLFVYALGMQRALASQGLEPELALLSGREPPRSLSLGSADERRP